MQHYIGGTWILGNVSGPNLDPCVIQEFVSSAKRPFPSELELIDFKDKTEDTRLQINKSVSDLTDGKYILNQAICFKSLKGDLSFDLFEMNTRGLTSKHTSE